MAGVPAGEPAGRIAQDPDFIGDGVAHDGDITPPILFQQTASAGRHDSRALRLVETDVGCGFGRVDVQREYSRARRPRNEVEDVHRSHRRGGPCERWRRPGPPRHMPNAPARASDAPPMSARGVGTAHPLDSTATPGIGTRQTSDQHDRGIADDVLDRVTKNNILVLHPTMRHERPRPDTEHPVRKDVIPGQKLQQRQRIVQALLPV